MNSQTTLVSQSLYTGLESRPAEENSNGDNSIRILIVALTVLLWSWSWVPQLIDLLNFGQQYSEFREVPKRAESANAAYKLIVGSIAVSVLILTVHGFAHRDRPRSHTYLLIALAWGGLHGIDFLQRARLDSLLIPAIFLAYVSHPRLTHLTYATLRWLILITASSSVVLGLQLPTLFLSSPGANLNNEKAIIGDRLLNGIFPTSNQLGLALALGLPVLLFSGSMLFRAVTLPVTILALVWAASRTSLSVAIVVLGIALLVRWMGTVTARRTLETTVTLGIVLVAAFPLFANDPSGFNGRVRIWQYSTSFVTDGHFLLGGGPMIYRDVNELTLALAAAPATGHNLFVSLLTVGGIVGLTTAVVWYISIWRGGIRLFEADLIPIFFFIAFLYVGTLEDPLRAMILSPLTFLTVPLLSAALNRRIQHVSIQAPKTLHSGQKAVTDE